MGEAAGEVWVRCGCILRCNPKVVIKKNIQINKPTNTKPLYERTVLYACTVYARVHGVRASHI